MCSSTCSPPHSQPQWDAVGRPEEPQLTTVIRAQRKSGGIFTAHTRLNKAPAKLRPLDYAERDGYIRGLVKEIVHDAGRYVQKCERTLY